MKKVRLCLEVHGLTQDENGYTAPSALAITFGEVSDEKYESINYFEAFANVDIAQVLAMGGLDGVVNPSDCKIISPEEYDEKYGDAE